jgi:microcystin-dependent protein
MALLKDMRLRDLFSVSGFNGTLDDINNGTTHKKVTQTEIENWNAKTTLAQVYPVGSIYIETTGTNPNKTFGFGTWTAFGSGRVLVGLDAGQTEFDTVEKTGGEKTHTLTTVEIPAHQHVIPDVRSATTGSATTLIARTSDTSSTVGSDVKTANDGGGGGAHNNLQPYITVYMWKRIA